MSKGFIKLFDIILRGLVEIFLRELRETLSFEMTTLIDSNHLNIITWHLESIFFNNILFELSIFYKIFKYKYNNY